MNIVLIQALFLLLGLACFSIAAVWGLRLLIDYMENKKKVLTPKN